MSIDKTIQKIIADHMQISPSDILMDSRLEEDLGVDSLDCVEIVMKIEEEFNIELSDEDAIKFSERGTVRELVSVASRLTGKASSAPKHGVLERTVQFGLDKVSEINESLEHKIIEYRRASDTHLVNKKFNGSLMDMAAAKQVLEERGYGDTEIRDMYRRMKQR